MEMETFLMMGGRHVVLESLTPPRKKQKIEFLKWSLAPCKLLSWRFLRKIYLNTHPRWTGSVSLSNLQPRLWKHRIARFILWGKNMSLNQKASTLRWWLIWLIQIRVSWVTAAKKSKIATIQ